MSRSVPSLSPTNRSFYHLAQFRTPRFYDDHFTKDSAQPMDTNTGNERQNDRAYADANQLIQENHGKYYGQDHADDIEQGLNPPICDMKKYGQVVEECVNYHQWNLGSYHQSNSETHNQVTGDKVKDTFPKLRRQARKGIHEEVQYHTKEEREDDRDNIS